jgi:hypothetical protein
MTFSKFKFPHIALLGVVVTAALLFGYIGHANKSTAQDADKSLDIERYPNEPLELVNLKIRDKALKNEIKMKSKNKGNGWGRDNVKFKETNGWFKHIKIKLRNISGKPIYGIRAGLHFQPPGLRMLFNMPLTWTKSLESDPLQPGAEIDLEVSDQLLNRTLIRMKQYDVDANLSSVSFSLDDAYFSDDIKWSRGVLLRRDSDDPNKWNPVDKPALSNTNLWKQPAGFKLIGLSLIAPQPQSLSQCQEEKGGELGYQCAGDYDYCLRIVELGNGTTGTLSAFSVQGDCERTGVSCLNDTTHSRLQEDPLCPSCDADGDGYESVSCGGDDCDDHLASVHPGATEVCNNRRDDDCDGDTDMQAQQDDCADLGMSWFVPTCTCYPYSPIIIDLLGNGFHLTDAQGGVNFDINNDGQPERLAWTAGSTDDAFLALDRNGNGSIDSGAELFGNFTVQPATTDPNGFLALAEYDKLANGGNGDGLITERDAIFSSLRLWQDTSHNGFSEIGELHTLRDLGLKSIDLDYKESRRKDQYGNWFRYRAKVRDMRNAQLGRWAWDVFLVSNH